MTLRFIIVKWSKVKDKEKILKVTKKKITHHIQGSPIILEEDFSTET